MERFGVLRRVVVGCVGCAVLLCLLVVPAAGAVDGPGWVVTRSPNPLTGTGQAFGVACPGVSDCIMVGSHLSRSGRGVALAERWDGRRWRILRPANPGFARATILNGVACWGGMGCTAVGETVDARGTDRTFAEMMGASGWRIVPTPTGPGQSTLFAVGCRSSSSCFAVGRTDAGSLVERWNGVSWSRQAVPAPPGAQFTELGGIACTKSACLAVGDFVDSSGTDVPLSEQWRDGRWRLLSTPAPDGASFAFLSGASCTPGGDCVAVGGSSGGTLVERLTGSAWQVEPSPSPTGAQFSGLFGVSCARVDRCSAVGGYVNADGHFVSFAVQWNGARWRLAATHDPRGDTDGNFLAGAACPRASSCFAVGQAGGNGTPTVLVDHWDGTRWELRHAPSPRGPAETQLNGVSCPAPSACTAVGTAGPTGGRLSTVAERWNGRRWQLQETPSPPGSNLNGVSCPQTSWCMAVGQSAAGTMALRWTAAGWRIVPIPTPSADAGLGGVKCLSRSFCMAVGGYPTASGGQLPFAEQWNGHAWHTLPVPPAAGAVQTYLGSIDCLTPTWCTTTGEQHFASGLVTPIADHWNGQRWAVQPTPHPAGTDFSNLPSVSCTAVTRCIAVGGTSDNGGDTGNGAIAERWNGTAWHLITIPSPAGSLSTVSCPTPSVCTAIGFYFTNAGGQLFADRLQNGSWSEQPTPLLPQVFEMAQPAVSCATRFTCIAVGGYEPDGPGSITLTEHWTASAPTTTVTASHPGARPIPSPTAACLAGPAWLRMPPGGCMSSALP